MPDHLAQLNVGRLVAETDDPRVAEFMAALDRVNGLGKRMPGFVWMMEGSGEPGKGNTEAKIDGDPRHVANLTLWESVEALETFVWNTVHERIFAATLGRGAWSMPLPSSADSDADGDVDMDDFWGLLDCFSGPADAPDFDPPSQDCLDRFDFDLEGDVDLLDLQYFVNSLAGPQ